MSPNGSNGLLLCIEIVAGTSITPEVVASNVEDVEKSTPKAIYFAFGDHKVEPNLPFTEAVVPSTVALIE